MIDPRSASFLSEPRLRLLRLVAAALLSVVCLGVLAEAAAAAVGQTLLVSRGQGSEGADADDDSLDPSISADGRYVAFYSKANNLSGVDSDGSEGFDVFRRDTQTGETLLVSRTTGLTGDAADGDSYEPSISADGRYVAFHSTADNLSDDDAPFLTDVFVRDTQTGAVTLVSRRTGTTGGAANDESFEPSISADGRYVAFSSPANNLSGGDDNDFFNVFVRDTQNGTTRLVSRGDGTSGSAADGDSSDPSISANGRRVAFDSTADNLSPNDDNNDFTNVFVRDDQTGATTLVSRRFGPNGTSANGDSFTPSISGDGRLVAFESEAENLSTEDGQFTRDVFVRDTQTGANRFVSRGIGATGAAANQDSGKAAISSDGRHVAFESFATNLAGGFDEDAERDVFSRDTQAATTRLVSRRNGVNGAAANGSSFAPAISSNGRFVAFESTADNLSTDDDNDFINIFRRDVLGP